VKRTAEADLQEAMILSSDQPSAMADWSIHLISIPALKCWATVSRPRCGLRSAITKIWHYRRLLRCVIIPSLAARFFTGKFPGKIFLL